MKKYSLLVGFLLLWNLVGAQTPLDSLLTVWEDTARPDSVRIYAYRDYIWDGYLYSKPDSALVLSDSLYEFSMASGYKKGIASVLNMQGFTHFMQGDYIKALSHHQRSLKIRKEIGDKRGIASSLNNIGLIYVERNNYTKALNHYMQSLKIKEEIGDKRGISVTLNNIGSIYNNQEAYDKALDCYKRSMAIKEEIGDQRGIAVSLVNIGQIYSQQGDQTSALDYYGRALEMAESMSDKRSMSQILENMGDVKYEQGNFSDALDNHKRSLALRDEIGDKDGSASSLNSIGFTYFKQKQYQSATTYCKRGLKLAQTIGAIWEQKEGCECLFNINKATNNSAKALEYHEQMIALTDSLQKEETIQELQRIEFNRKVKEDSLLQVEKAMKREMVFQEETNRKDRNKNIAMGVGLFFILLSAGLYSRWRYVKKSKAVIEEEKDRSENLLLNILPSEIAEELKTKGSADTRDFENVSILFTDFVGFTEASEKLSAKELIEEINHCFKTFDILCDKYGIEKIKTIGDAYMAAGGIPIPSDVSVKNTVLAALEMQAFMAHRVLERKAKNEIPFEMRLGIHTGPVVAGIVGVKKFQYDIWGDTVNTASRMESGGDIGKVNISEDTYQCIKDNPAFVFEARGEVEVKGKGEMTMYFVSYA
ncbi:adenylate/guanylate cyclase domain-containing protein [Aureisphaera galaxeae]|uniref:adenylate/guanylate cyclase domain-containing protein n=1 Tax=Aureisphaera galaxeae TaxID=1538023 RepID=UPI0023503429|nr:adenylate/guanylate cyclase domain-containing protein [Aureisphaera galaxeae]MDC8003709.1 adenylate/guanylate cyclase domain-containing protein [Aureisphaera galaxeae]